MTEHLLSNIAAVPLEEQAAEEARMAVQPLRMRRAELLTALGNVDVKDDEEMRRAIDKIVLSKALRDAVDAKLQPIGTPYREASHAVHAVAHEFMVVLRTAEQTAQRSIDDFRRRQRVAAANAKNEQNEREAKLREQAGLEAAAPAAPVVQADVKLGSARSDFRGQVFDRKIIKVTITDPRALPDEVLKSPGVTAALESAVRQLAKLTKNIPGATIEDDRATSVKAK